MKKFVTLFVSLLFAASLLTASAQEGTYVDNLPASDSAYLKENTIGLIAPAKEKSNSNIYIAIGAVVVVLAGGAFLLKKKK